MPEKNREGFLLVFDKKEGEMGDSEEWGKEEKPGRGQWLELQMWVKSESPPGGGGNIQAQVHVKAVPPSRVPRSGLWVGSPTASG